MKTYPIEIYLAIIVIDGLLSVFSVMAKGTDYYKDIAALIFACFISVYLGLASVSGTAYIYGVNATSAIVTSPVQDDGLMWLFYIIATIQGIFVLLEIVEAYEEHIAGKVDQDSLIS